MYISWIKRGMTVLLLAAVWMLSGKVAAYLDVTAVTQSPCVVVLDAGHGGADPGKVAADGSLEKDINLQIAEKVRKKLEEAKVTVVMTRETDEMQQDKKTDMRYRCEIINQAGALCAVSIHQNSYPDAKAKGAQVFYFEGSEEGKTFADILQNSLIENFDPANTRVSKGNTTYYLLRKTEVPLVIVECGFMSNAEETARLKTETVQEDIAEAISRGILQYVRENGRGWQNIKNMLQ